MLRLWPTRAAEVKTCPRCGALLIVGLSDGVTVRCDAIAITTQGEVLALFAKRMTYSLHRGVLLHRDNFRINAGRKGLTLYSHQCHTVIEAAYRERISAPVPLWVVDDPTPPY